ncbi:MAG: primosomal protein N' [Cardiobacteriaceae bacterium]|nr:primosomal protein N' [Cardiobacteriaceae bacterium]
MLTRISVAVPRPLPTTFDYICAMPVQCGARVKVPFGRTYVIGIVVAVMPYVEQDDTLKQVETVLDEQPLLNDALLALLHFSARYYQFPLGEVMQAALPKWLREGKAAVRQLPRYWRLTENGQAALATRLGEKQAMVLTQLAHGEMDEAHLRTAYNCSAAWLDDLQRRGWLESRSCWRGVVADTVAAPVLNRAQTEVLSVLPESGFSVSLLDGVTGSGKTEIYIRWIEQLTAQGGQVLLLLPEIGLVEAIAMRLAARLGANIALHHSGLADGARLAQWLAVQAGDARVLVGTRSAVFAPFVDLRAIIVDEEHDGAFKQQDGFRYHARDLALMRAKQANIPVLLGSATPSLESYHQVWKGSWQYLRLTERATAVSMPKVHIENMDGAAACDGLSHELIRHMRQVLANGGQVMLFLNRRGFAPLLRCGACGWCSECEACDAMMTAHTASGLLQCHHCGRQEALPSRCPACGSSSELHMIGLGTQRLERTVAQQFPKARVLRIDSDAFTTNRQFEDAVAQIHKGEVDIILGTQWLSKGHHFPRLQLVVVVDADQALYSVDFRGEERLAQILVQVGGRAGRERSGQVWVQTRQPQHPVFSVLIQPYEVTAQRLYEARQRAQLPPHSAQVALMARHADSARVLQTLTFTRDGAQQAGIGKDWLWFGPAPAVMPRKDGQHRAHLLIQAASKAAVQKELPQLVAWLQAQGKAFHVRCAVDVDPFWLE